MINEQIVRKLIVQGENERVEFKSLLRDTSTLVKNVSAFANTHGGMILVGIQEPNKIVGTDPKQVIQLVERSRNAFSPAVDLDVTTVMIDSKPVAVITVPESPEIVFANGMALKRTGDHNLALTPSEITAKLAPESDSQKIDRLTESVSKLTDTVERQSQTIDDLRKQQEAASSPRSKAIDYIISGLVGAVIGAIITALFAG
jgi:predicted HTH transcriptional regulator